MKQASQSRKAQSPKVSCSTIWETVKKVSFQTITDRPSIKTVLHAFVLGSEAERQKSNLPSFIPAIYVKPGAEWQGHTVTSGGLIIEGSRPMAVATFHDTGEIRYALTNSDSDYQLPIGYVNLSEITKIEILR